MSIRFSTTANGNDGIEPSAQVPIGSVTTVKIEAWGRLLQISMNSTVVARRELPADRIFGAANLYASDNWYAPANALFGNLKIEPLDFLFLNGISKREVSHLTELRQLQNEFYGLMTIPQNYTMTFDVKPLGAFNNWGNLFHFTMVVEFNIGW
jgi:hypothetical protein